MFNKREHVLTSGPIPDFWHAFYAGIADEKSLVANKDVTLPGIPIGRDKGNKVGAETLPIRLYTPGPAH